jgi:hypothetical protein
MKNLWWSPTDKDEVILEEMNEYVKFKQKNCINVIFNCFLSQNEVTILHSKRLLGGCKTEIRIVSVASHSELKEWLHYYALCSIATSHGAELLVSI